MGLNRLDQKRGVNTVYRHRPEDPGSLGNDESWPLLEDSEGALWFGTFGGLDRLDLRSQRRKIARERAVSAELRQLAELKDELLADRALKLEERGRLIAELEHKNAELKRYAYTVSHDLKSPLVTIKGYLGFLEKDAGGDAERLRRDR